MMMMMMMMIESNDDHSPTFLLAVLLGLHLLHWRVILVLALLLGHGLLSINQLIMMMKNDIH